MAKRRVDQTELDTIMKQHHLWLESNNMQGIKADLSNTNCSGLTFRIRQDSTWTNLHGRPNLSEVDFTNADMRGVDLSLVWWQPLGTSVTFTGATMPDGHTYGEYLSEWVSEYFM